METPSRTTDSRSQVSSPSPAAVGTPGRDGWCGRHTVRGRPKLGRVRSEWRGRVRTVLVGSEVFEVEEIQGCRKGPGLT